MASRQGITDWISSTAFNGFRLLETVSMSVRSWFDRRSINVKIEKIDWDNLGYWENKKQSGQGISRYYWLCLVIWFASRMVYDSLQEKTTASIQALLNGQYEFGRRSNNDRCYKEFLREWAWQKSLFCKLMQEKNRGWNRTDEDEDDAVLIIFNTHPTPYWKFYLPPGLRDQGFEFDCVTMKIDCNVWGKFMNFLFRSTFRINFSVSRLWYNKITQAVEDWSIATEESRLVLRSCFNWYHFCWQLTPERSKWFRMDLEKYIHSVKTVSPGISCNSLTRSQLFQKFLIKQE